MALAEPVGAPPVAAAVALARRRDNGAIRCAKARVAVARAIKARAVAGAVARAPAADDLACRPREANFTAASEDEVALRREHRLAEAVAAAIARARGEHLVAPGAPKARVASALAKDARPVTRAVVGAKRKGAH